MGVRRTISRSQEIRLRKLGATVSHDGITATVDQLWRVPIVGEQQVLLNKRGQLTLGSGGGGGDTTEILIDFQNGVYQMDGADVALGDLVGANSDYANFSTDYIQENVGYTNGTDTADLSLKGEALSRLLAGHAMMVEVVVSGTGFVFDLYGPGFSPDLTLDLSNHGFGNQDIPVEQSGVLRFALKFSGSDAKLSYAGGDVITDSGNVSGATANAGFNLISHTIRKIVIVPAETDEDLRALCVPNDAKIHIDLVQQFAWTQADGFVAIDTLLGSDPNTENGWDITAYNPDSLTADGYVDGGALGFIGDLRSLLVDGATAVLRTKQTADGVGLSGYSFALMSSDGNDGIEIDVTQNFGGSIRITSWNGPLDNRIESIVNDGVAGAVNVSAFTITETRADIAMNGSNATAGALDNTDRPSGNPLVAAIFSSSSLSNALQSITIYDPLPSTDGLSELSQTGVVNTAPHDLTFTLMDEGQGGFFTSTGATTATVSAANLDNNTVDVIINVSATDDDGNPLTVSLSSDDGGAFTVANVGQWKVQWTNGAGGPSVGDHSFTLRATDPGGLYVEQTFTITVTA